MVESAPDTAAAAALLRPAKSPEPKAPARVLVAERHFMGM